VLKESFHLHQVLQVKVQKLYSKELVVVGMMCLQKSKTKAEDIVQFKLVNVMSKEKRNNNKKREQDYNFYGEDYRKFKKNKHDNDRNKKNTEQKMFIDWNLL